MVKNKMNKLSIYRKNIDKIDKVIFRMLVNRQSLVKKIGIYKKVNGVKIFDKERENKILKKIRAESRKYKTNEKNIEKIFKSIIKNSKEIQK